MSDHFLETDEALHALIQELERFKSSSEHLSLTRESVEQLLGSTQTLTGKAGELLGRGEQQLDAITTLASDTEQHVQLVVKEQQALAESIGSTLNAILVRLDTLDEKVDTLQETLDNHVEPLLNDVAHVTRSNRFLLFILLLSALVAAGLGWYLWALPSAVW